MLLGRIYEDKDRQEALVRGSELDWTIVRPGFLTDGAERGSYEVFESLDGVKARKISRADVARFLLTEALEPRYLRRTVLVT